MANYSMIDDFHIHKNDRFLQIAESLKPELTKRTVSPVAISSNVDGPWENIEMLPARAFKRGESVVLDFGDHQVGYLTLELDYAGSHPDAPAYLRFRFAERLCELAENTESYGGWLGKGWFQEECIHVDMLPGCISLPRRYAFRYLKIEVIDVSPKYSLLIRRIVTQTVTSAGKTISPLETGDELIDKIDRVSLRTLQNCMHSVFEDGPKRDRRMWLGDFRLQAKVNYLTFQNFDLARRCLYLFAGLTFNEGKVPACLFLEPEPEPDDTYLFDYALLFGPALLDYYEATGDKETLSDLYPTAIRQLEIGLSNLDQGGILPDHSGEFWCFVDWGDGLNTQAASLAILIYSMMQGKILAQKIGDAQQVCRLEKQIKTLRENALTFFWDNSLGLFISGPERQVSWATQVWMVLSGILPPEQCRAILRRADAHSSIIPMITPYMMHHYIEALASVGETEQAISEIRRYWGGMVREGADTFWEVYYPGRPGESPYDCISLNSFCHAWSCTPSLFLRRYFADQ